MSTLPRITPLVVTRRAFDMPIGSSSNSNTTASAHCSKSTPPARASSREPDTLAAALAKRLCVKDAILDGEIICVDATGRPIFIEMLRGRHPVCDIHGTLTRGIRFGKGL